MHSLRTLTISIAAATIIRGSDIDNIIELLHNKTPIEREDADMLFEVYYAVKGNSRVNSNRWSNFFVETISDHVLKNEIQPYHILPDTAEWLQQQLTYNETEVDDVGAALLKYFDDTAEYIPVPFQQFIDGNI